MFVLSTTFACAFRFATTAQSVRRPSAANVLPAADTWDDQPQPRQHWFRTRTDCSKGSPGYLNTDYIWDGCCILVRTCCISVETMRDGSVGRGAAPMSQGCEFELRCGMCFCLDR